MFTKKLACLCRLALLCQIPQEVLLDTYLLRKRTWLSSVHECWLLIHAVWKWFHPLKTLTCPVSFSSWYCLICFPWHTSYVQYDSICNVGKPRASLESRNTTSALQLFSYAPLNAAQAPIRKRFQSLLPRDTGKLDENETWEVSPCRSSCFVWTADPAARPDWAHCTPYRHPKTTKDTTQTQEERERWGSACQWAQER